MPPNIADVARRAQVSTATVSRVLAGRGRARPETRERVFAAARELGYRPSGVARSLRQRATRTLGLIVTDIENPFFPQLVRAVEDAAHDLGYAILLCNAADDPEREAGYLELLVDRWVDGVVIAASSLGGRHREWLADAPLPIVLVNSTDHEIGLSTISSDNYAGGALAARHLADLGHRRIGLIAGPARNVDGPDRLAGALDALEATGISRRDVLLASDEAGVAGGQRAAAEILERHRAVTGLIAYNDLMAIGAMRAIRAAGLRIPDDVSVIGFDDVDLAAFVDPPLTTIAQATSQMGHWAVTQLAAELIERATARADLGPASDPVAPTARAAVHVILPVRLEIRGSTGPAPADRLSPARARPRGERQRSSA
jgi:LacI family transcriptional regulator, galactose operon repressor